MNTTNGKWYGRIVRVADIINNENSNGHIIIHKDGKIMSEIKAAIAKATQQVTP